MNLLTLAFLVLSATAANVSPPCGPHASMAKGLRKVAGEEVLWSGIIKDGAFTLELWVNPNTGTWSELRIDTNGTACFGHAPTGWEFGPIEPKGDPT